MTTPSAPPTDPRVADRPRHSIVDEQGVISSTIYCRGCHYDLKGLAADGPCPECGKPASDSLRGELLEFADDTYLATIHRGVFLIQASLILRLVGVLLSFLGAALAGSFRSTVRTGGAAPATTFTAPSRGLIDVLPAVLSLGFAAVSVWGWYLFSTQDPGVDERDRADRARRVLRITTVAIGVLTVATQALALALPPSIRGAPFGAGHGAALALSIATLAAWGTQFFSAMMYIGWLARRVPSPTLINRSRTYMWLLPVVFIPGTAVCGAGLLVAPVMYYIFLDQVRVSLKLVRERKAWAHTARTAVANQGANPDGF